MLDIKNLILNLILHLLVCWCDPIVKYGSVCRQILLSKYMIITKKYGEPSPEDSPSLLLICCNHYWLNLAGCHRIHPIVIAEFVTPLVDAISFILLFSSWNLSLFKNTPSKESHLNGDHACIVISFNR